MNGYVPYLGAAIITKANQDQPNDEMRNNFPNPTSQMPNSPWADALIPAELYKGVSLCSSDGEKAGSSGPFYDYRSLLNLRCSKSRVWHCVLGASLALGAWSSGFSADWPQWGGQPLRNMYSPEKGLPDSF